MNMNRRQFLKAGLMSCGALGLNMTSPMFLQRQLLAADPEADRKLLFIFQRGGNDGINTVIPRGDPDYNSDTRPTLFLPESTALDTGNGFAQLHPRLQPLMEIYNRTALNGAAGPGNLAVLHRIGYYNQSRSHFDSQQYWENGTPGDSALEEGMIYRQIDRTLDLSDPRNSFVAAALSSSQMVSLKGPKPLPNFERPDQFAFAGSSAQVAKFLGKGPQNPGGADGSGLMGLYGGAPDHHWKDYRPLVHQTGQLLGSTIETLQNAIAAGQYVPENGAAYPTGSFGQKLQQAAMLFKRTPVRVLGMNLGGWDTHTSQGQANGNHGDRLYELALGLQALYRDLQSQWDKLLIVTMTEFGRTSEENGSRGTDHAEASVMFVAGGAVKGGVYNCDASTWQQGDMFSRRGRYLSRRTDFRSVFGEIFTGHFGDDPALLNQIIPGYAAAAEMTPSDFMPLGFLAV